MYEKQLYRVTLPYATFGIVFYCGLVLEAAPWARWMKGKNLDYIQAWIHQRKGTIELVEISLENFV